jgi:ArsR family transcriptional regulator, arsenate/arsenite/antimonite-responsive transcriptional repressor
MFDRSMVTDTSIPVNLKLPSHERAEPVTEPAVDSCCASVLAAPLAEAEAEDLARAFAALADPVRLRLLSLIADAGQVCSCDLLEPLGKAQPTVSHHTKVLSESGLIVGEKRGRWVWWRVVPERVRAVRDALNA